MSIVLLTDRKGWIWRVVLFLILLSVNISVIEMVARASGNGEPAVMTETFELMLLMQKRFQTGAINVEVEARKNIVVTLTNTEFNVRGKQKREEQALLLKGIVVDFLHMKKWTVDSVTLQIYYKKYEKKFFIVELRDIVDTYQYTIDLQGETAASVNARIMSLAGKCLDIHLPCQDNDGCRVQVWECNGQSQQQWTVASGVIRSRDGMCLDVQSHCQKENGCRVQVWTCNGSRQQHWEAKGFTIHSGAGKCLDVQAGCRNDNGCGVTVWDCNGQEQQLWTVIAADS